MAHQSTCICCISQLLFEMDNLPRAGLIHSSSILYSSIQCGCAARSCALLGRLRRSAYFRDYCFVWRGWIICVWWATHARADGLSSWLPTSSGFLAFGGKHKPCPFGWVEPFLTLHCPRDGGTCLSDADKTLFKCSFGTGSWIL